LQRSESSGFRALYAVAHGLAIVWCLGASARMEASPAPRPVKIPVILDTDIGDEMDDTWALALLLRSPRLDLKLVTTTSGNTPARAKVAARLLALAGRTEVDVAPGPRTSEAEIRQASWLQGYSLADYPGRVHADGVAAMVETIMASPERVTVVCIGPLTNVRAALEREPRIAERARLVAMLGSLRRGYGGKRAPEAEYNVRSDVAACRAALMAPWSKTIAPIDTCGLVRLRGPEFAAIRASTDPLARAVIENYRAWCGPHPELADTQSSILFDTLAVYLAGSRDFVYLERLGLRVTDVGMTVVDPTAPAVTCATDWRNLVAFQAQLVQRLTGR
jgi:inosine-uridine nucleoside N-ribohydrolase